MSIVNLIPTSFTKYNLSPKDVKVALLNFTELQKMYIQNLIADAAEEKLALTVPANDIPSFLQKEAELHGQIEILKYILSQIDEASLPVNNPSE